MQPLLAAILDALPHPQCQRCGYPDCAAYAAAIADGSADINQCPPGGQAGVASLAALTGKTEKPLNPAFGREQERTVAFIDEDWCIGCTLCLDACPTDAILGANKQMHTVIEGHCTGCELCIPVCPVDCISLDNVTGDRTGWAAWSRTQADAALRRYQLHVSRTQKAPPAVAVAQPADTHKKDTIAAALARARARRDNG